MRCYIFIYHSYPVGCLILSILHQRHRLNNLKPDWRWQLTPSGRVAHREKYVKDIARARGLSLVSYERIDGFRQERGQDVRGHFFVFAKKQQASKEEL